MALNDCLPVIGGEVIDDKMVVWGVVIEAREFTQGAVTIPGLEGTWDANTDPNVTGVQFEYQESGLAAGAVRTDAQGIESQSWSATNGLIAGKTYYVKYRAAGGGIFGLWSTPAPYTLPGTMTTTVTPIASGTVLLDALTVGAFSLPKPSAGQTAFLKVEMWAGGGPGGNATNAGKVIYPGAGGGGGGKVTHKVALADAPDVISGLIGDGGQSGGDGGNTTCAALGLTAYGGTAAVSNTTPGTGGAADGGSEDNETGRDGALGNIWDGGGAADGGGDQTVQSGAGTSPGGGGAGGGYSQGGAGAVGRVRITASDT